MEAHTRLCPSCAAPVPDQAAFCSQCGTALGRPADAGAGPADPGPADPRSGEPLGWGVTRGVLALILVAGSLSGPWSHRTLYYPDDTDLSVLARVLTVLALLAALATLLVPALGSGPTREAARARLRWAQVGLATPLLLVVLISFGLDLSAMIPAAGACVLAGAGAVLVLAGAVPTEASRPPLVRVVAGFGIVLGSLLGGATVVVEAFTIDSATLGLATNAAVVALALLLPVWLVTLWAGLEVLAGRIIGWAAAVAFGVGTLLTVMLLGQGEGQAHALGLLSSASLLAGANAVLILGQVAGVLVLLAAAAAIGSGAPGSVFAGRPRNQVFRMAGAGVFFLWAAVAAGMTVGSVVLLGSAEDVSFGPGDIWVVVLLVVHALVGAVCGALALRHPGAGPVAIAAAPSVVALALLITVVAQDPSALGADAVSPVLFVVWPLVAVVLVSAPALARWVRSSTYPTTPTPPRE